MRPFLTIVALIATSLFPIAAPAAGGGLFSRVVDVRAESARLPGMDLTDDEKREIKSLLDAGQVLPDKYRWKLFAQPRQTELIWPGKTSEVTSVVLPFQVIEHIDEPRAETLATNADLFSLDKASGRQSGGWTNKLIWGDNKLVLSSLKNGPMRREIEEAGGLKLVYIDPPFDVGYDFSVDVEIGENKLTKEPSIIETQAYNDTWGSGHDSYSAMLYQRLLLAHELLAPDGVIFVHTDWHVNHLIKSMLSEIFGGDNHINELVWHYYNKMQGNINRFASNHDIIYWYRKSGSFTFTPQKEEREATTKQIKRVWDKEKQKIVNAKGPDGKVIYIETDERTVDDVWVLSMLQPADQTENVGYATQKPVTVLTRILQAATKPGDLVADFFCGSGTTLVAAEELGRKWIGSDLGRFAIHSSRKRLIQTQRDQKLRGKPYRSFEILNLGKYERQYFAGIDPTLPEEQRRAQSAKKEQEYLALILAAYKCEPIQQTPPFHGKRGSALVCVGPIDAPVTRGLVLEAIEAAIQLGVISVDLLGFEFEMGLVPKVVEEASLKGVGLTLKYIPKDVFDKRAIEKNQVVFYDVAYVQAEAKVKGLAVTVSLSDFGVSYRQEDIERVAGEMKPKGSKVIVDQGQVVKITKDAAGAVKREVLTKKWEDWIDYWSVDFNYHSKQEVLMVTLPDGAGRMVDRPQWTGGYIFENEWQSFRTRRERKLELASAPHTYDAKGSYHIAVKVIDIFGNDTTKVIEVKV